MKILPTKNKRFGFYGTAFLNVGDEIYVNQLWCVSSSMIQKKTGFTPEQTRYLLDSRCGRHICDQFYTEIQKGLASYKKAFQEQMSASILKKNYDYFVDEKDFYKEKMYE